MRYLTIQDTKKSVLQALKEAFPNVRFSIRAHSFANGSSLTVTWTDGPDVQAVETITNRFKSSSFDGMQDLKHLIVHKIDGEEVSHAADYIHTARRHTTAFIERVIAHTVTPESYLWTLGVRPEHFRVKTDWDGHPALDTSDPVALRVHPTLKHQSAYAEVRAALNATAADFYLEHSPTAAAVEIARVH